MTPLFNFVERCPFCGQDIHWQGRIFERPPCQNCQKQQAGEDVDPFVSRWRGREKGVKKKSPVSPGPRTIATVILTPQGCGAKVAYGCDSNAEDGQD